MAYTGSAKDVPINSTKGQIGKLWKNVRPGGSKKRPAEEPRDENPVEVINTTLPGCDPNNRRASIQPQHSVSGETQFPNVDRPIVDNDRHLSRADLFSKIEHLEGIVTRLQREKSAALLSCEELRNSAGGLQDELSTAKHKYEKLDTNYETLNDDLNKKTREMRRLREEHNEKEAKWQRRAEVEKGLQDKINAQETQLQSVERERDKLRSTEVAFHNLEHKAKITREGLDECKKELEKVQGMYSETQKKYAAASNELSRIKLESRSMLDDAFFQTKWKYLQADIGEWADTYFRVAQKGMWRIRFPQGQKGIDIDLLKLSEDCADLLSEEGSFGRSMVAEAYLWSFIEEEVWNCNPSSYCKGMYWAHTLRSDFCRMENFLRPGTDRPDADRRAFYKWKANTVELLLQRLKPSIEGSRVPVDPEILNYLVNRVLCVLKPWSTHDDDRLCRRDLRDIFQSAIDFDSQMNEQFSLMYAAPTPYDNKARHSFAFNSLEMEPASKDIQMVDRQPVGIVVSPALIRSGTALGEGYDKVWILAKSRVMPQRFASSSQRPNNSSKGTGMILGNIQRQLNI